MKPRYNQNNIKIFKANNMKVMKQYEDDYFDLAVVDPPYFDGPNKLGFYGGRCSKTGVSRNGYKKLGEWDLPSIEYFKELKRISKEQIIWGINYFSYAFEVLPGSGRIVWDKMNTSSTFSDCEIAYCSSIAKTIKFEFMWNGMLQGNPQDGRIMQGNKKLNEKRYHPTQKPIELYNRIFREFVDSGHKIIDTYLGSGSSAVSAYRHKLEFVGIEIEQEYVNVAIERIKTEVHEDLFN